MHSPWPCPDFLHQNLPFNWTPGDSCARTGEAEKHALHLAKLLQEPRST